MLQHFLGVFTLICVLTVCAIPVFAQDRIVVVADRWMPYNGRPGGRNEGYAVEIVRAIFEPKGYTVLYREMPWKRAVDDVRNGRADILIGSLGNDVPDFLFPQETLGKDVMCFYANRPEWKFTGPESLSKIMVGLVKGYGYREWLLAEVKRFPRRFHVMHGDEPVVRLLRMLKDDRIQAMPGNKAVVDYYVKRLDLGEDVFLAGCFDDPEERHLYFALSPLNRVRSEKFIGILDKGISTMRKSGQLNHLLIKYGLKDWVRLR